MKDPNLPMHHLLEHKTYLMLLINTILDHYTYFISDKIVEEIFDIANAYKIQTAVDASKDLLLAQLDKLVADNFTVLVSSRILLNKALPIVSLAEKWNNDVIMEKSIERVSTVPYVNIVNSDEYKNLKEATQIRILTSRLKRIDTENRVFDKALQ